MTRHFRKDIDHQRVERTDAPAPVYQRDQALADIAARGLGVAAERLDSDSYLESFWRGTLALPVVGSSAARADGEHLDEGGDDALVDESDEESKAADQLRRESVIAHVPEGRLREVAGRAFDRRERARKGGK